MRVMGNVVVVSGVLLALSTGRAAYASCNPGPSGCAGYSCYTDTFGGSHWYASGDPNMTDLGPNCPLTTTAGQPTPNGFSTTSYGVVLSGPSTFQANGGKAATVTATVTDRATGLLVSGAYVEWSISEWTYRTNDNQTDTNGVASFSFGHVRPVSVTITAQAGPSQGTVDGTGTWSCQGYEAASGYTVLNFLSPASNSLYTCRYPAGNSDYIEFDFSWNTYKTSPAGYTIVVSGEPGTGIYSATNSPNRAGSGSTTFNCCQFEQANVNQAYGTLYINYFTLSGPGSYAAATASSNKFGFN